MAGGEKGPTKSQPDLVLLAGHPEKVVLAGNLELLLVAQSGATGAAKLRVRSPRRMDVLTRGLQGSMGLEDGNEYFIKKH